MGHQSLIRSNISETLERLEQIISQKPERKTTPHLAEIGRTVCFCSMTPHLAHLMRNDSQLLPIDWAMCVPPVFYPALDIILSNPKPDKAGHYVYVQGSAFSFEVGQMLYDTAACYSRCCLPIRKPERLAVQIISAHSAVPSKPRQRELEHKPTQADINQFVIDYPNLISEPTVSKVKKKGQTKYKLKGYTKREPGSVALALYKPTQQEGWVEKYGKTDMTQDEFVRGLIGGFEL